MIIYILQAYPFAKPPFFFFSFPGNNCVKYSLNTLEPTQHTKINIAYTMSKQKQNHRSPTQSCSQWYSILCNGSVSTKRDKPFGIQPLPCSNRVSPCPDCHRLLLSLIFLPFQLKAPGTSVMLRAQLRSREETTDANSLGRHRSRSRAEASLTSLTCRPPSLVDQGARGSAGLFMLGVLLKPLLMHRDQGDSSQDHTPERRDV